MERLSDLQLERLSDLQRKIIDVLAQNPDWDREHIRAELKLSKSSIDQAMPALKKMGVIRDEMRLARSWNPLQKFFVFIETKSLSESVTTYQWDLVREIRDEVSRYKTILIEDVDIVMGADWDIVLALRAKDHIQIANFVVSFLRTRDTISRTRTTFVLPEVKDSPNTSNDRNPKTS